MQRLSSSESFLILILRTQQHLRWVGLRGLERDRQTGLIAKKSHNIPSRTESLLLFNCPNFSARYCLVRSMFSKTVSLLKRICSLMRIFLLSNDKFVELFAGCFNFPTLSFFFTKSFCFVFFTLPMNTFVEGEERKSQISSVRVQKLRKNRCFTCSLIGIR